MLHPWTRFLLLIVPSAVLWSHATALCLAQVRLQEDNAFPQEHGLPEILSQQLFQDREFEALLRSAESISGRQDTDLKRDALLRIFAVPHDIFEFDSDSATATSLRRHALSILLKSPPDVQRQWVQANEVIAKQEIRTALRTDGRMAAARVARQFPLTAAGIQAQVVDLSCELLKGDFRNTEAQIIYLEERYAGTVLSDELQRQVRPLRQMISSLQTARQQNPQAQDANSSVTQLSMSSAESTGTLSPPWPKPLWTWRESIWSFPGAPQPETGYLLMMFDPESENRFEEFNNWPPVFWGESLIVRSPFRLVALNRANGQEQWSVPTDTFERQPDTIYDELEVATRRALSESQSMFERASPIYGMTEFGLLASDSEFLFFVDRFSFFTAKNTLAENQAGRVLRRRNGFPVLEEDSDIEPKPIATRLVALRRSASSPLPIVAWQIGDRAGFEYHPVTHGLTNDAEPSVTDSISGNSVSESSDPAVSESSTAAMLWSGHRFLAPPTGQGTRLFVLTLNETQLFLNCLQRNTGELLWRQPLIYTDASPLIFFDTSIFSKRASTCVTSGDTVVCNLSDGVVIGVHAIDGTLLWATALRDEAASIPRSRFGMELPPDENPIASPSILIPWISDGVVVCCTHTSASLYGLSLETGAILWKSSRRAFGAGEVGGSPDYYVAGISGDQVILVGDRHCRSVNLKSGLQNWVVQIPGVSGLAECRGDRCIIPVLAGQAVTVDLKAGTLLSKSPVNKPVNSMDQYGAIASDSELICVSTPTCVAAFPRVDSLLRNADQLPSLNANPARRVLIQAQAHLINGDLEASLNLLRNHVAARTSNVSPDPQVDEFLAELVLQQWGRTIGARLEKPQPDLSNPLAMESVEVPQDAGLLATLQLPDELSFKADVFKLLSEPTALRMGSPLLVQLQQRREWNAPIRLTNLWNLRPELLIDVPHAATPIEADAIASLSRAELRHLVARFLQHTEFLPDNLRRQRLAECLLDRHEFPAAELFLSKWSEEALSAGDESASEQPLGFLRQLRSSADQSRPAGTPDTLADHSSLTPDSGLTSAVVTPLAFEIVPCIRQSDLEFETLQRGQELSAIPDHRGLNVYVADDANGVSEVMAFNSGEGTLRDRVALPFQYFNMAGRFDPLSNHELTPSLFPICGARDMAMVSCPVAGSGSLLWTRHIGSNEQESTRVEFGPLGADHFVWQFGDELHCSHPLTGKDLWTRKLALSQSEQTKMFRGTSPSVRRIAGDRRAIVVMGSDSRSFERFRTRDGRMLGSGRLEIGRSESVVTVGRCLLYTDANAQLHLFDSATGKDELGDDEPIVPLSNLDGKTICQVLENNRILVVSSTLELILIDVDGGRVLFRTPAANYVRSGFVFSFSAFNRNGKLFAALSEQGGGGRDLERSFVRGSPRMSKGSLICLDATTGNVHWSLPLNGGVFPEIHGDPTDLLLSWSMMEQSFDANVRFQRADRLLLEIIDTTTGQIIAQSPIFSSFPPLRCSHYADESLIELKALNATISIRASSDESVVRP